MEKLVLAARIAMRRAPLACVASTNGAEAGAARRISPAHVEASYSSGIASTEGFGLGLNGPSGVLASASASAFAFRGTHVILMSANCWIKETACSCKGLRCSALTFHLPFSWLTTRRESRHTRKCAIPRERAASRPLMRARYSATW